MPYDFEYTSKHFPTGAIVETKIVAESEADFLRFLNKWNVEGNGEYIFTAKVRHHEPRVTIAHDFKNSTVIQKEIRPISQVRVDGGYWTSIK